jgi:hypothetical protein
MGVLSTFAFNAGAQTATAPSATTQPATTPATSNADIASDWGDVIKDAVPSSSASEMPAAKVSQMPVPATSQTGNFLNHFYFENRTEYTHGDYNFSGQPTATGVVDVQPGNTVNPTGFPYPPAFQNSTNEMYSYLNLGTRGLGSERINTNFALRYRQDLTALTNASPGLSVINTFNGAHLFEILSGYVEINGKPTDGWFANSSIRLGRQTMYGPYMAQYDGASYNRTGNRYALTLYGGRRFTYYSDPVQRAIGGVDFKFRLTNRISVGYQGMFYIKGTNGFSYRQEINQNWLLNAYFRMVGSHPVDFTASTFWTPSNGKTTVGLSYFQKITNQDYIYDYTYGANDQDPYNVYRRLNLNPKSPYSQFTIDARHSFTSYLRLGGAMVFRELNNNRDQGPFDTSFNDYRVNAQVFPWRRIETFVEYHQHNSDRKNPVPQAFFPDVSAVGETRIQDLTVQVGRAFFENRLNVQGGAFFRRINFQGPYYIINNAQDKGWLANAAWRLDSHTRLFFDYSLDTDFYVWRPSIQNGQVFRLGLDWKY